MEQIYGEVAHIFRSFYTTEEQIHELFSKYTLRAQDEILTDIRTGVVRSSVWLWDWIDSKRPRVVSVLLNTIHIKMLWIA